MLRPTTTTKGSGVSQRRCHFVQNASNGNYCHVLEQIRLICNEGAKFTSFSLNNLRPLEKSSRHVRLLVKYVLNPHARWGSVLLQGVVVAIKVNRLICELTWVAHRLHTDYSARLELAH